jgi:hypothetical protein
MAPEQGRTMNRLMVVAGKTFRFAVCFGVGAFATLWACAAYPAFPWFLIAGPFMYLAWAAYSLWTHAVNVKRDFKDFGNRAGGLSEAEFEREFGALLSEHIKR